MKTNKDLAIGKTAAGRHLEAEENVGYVKKDLKFLMYNFEIFAI